MLCQVQGEVRLDMECPRPSHHRTLPYGTLMLSKPVLQRGAISVQPEEWNNSMIDDIQYANSFSDPWELQLIVAVRNATLYEMNIRMWIR